MAHCHWPQHLPPLPGVTLALLGAYLAGAGTSLQPQGMVDYVPPAPLEGLPLHAPAPFRSLGITDTSGWQAALRTSVCIYSRATWLQALGLPWLQPLAAPSVLWPLGCPFPPGPPACVPQLSCPCLVHRSAPIPGCLCPQTLSLAQAIGLLEPSAWDNSGGVRSPQPPTRGTNTDHPPGRQGATLTYLAKKDFCS